jgi:hypothetical protein
MPWMSLILGDHKAGKEINRPVAGTTYLLFDPKKVLNLSLLAPTLKTRRSV